MRELQATVLQKYYLDKFVKYIVLCPLGSILAHVKSTKV